MTIPLIAFLYLYLLFILVWLIFNFIAFYHIIKYGQISFASLTVAFIYLAVAIIILFLSFEYLSQTDWSVGLTIYQGGFNFFGASNF